MSVYCVCISSEAFMLAFPRFEWITTQKYLFEHEKVRQFMVAESISSHRTCYC